MNIVPGGSRVMRPPNDSDGLLAFTVTQNDDVVTPGTETPFVNDDANMAAVVNATTDTAWDIEVSARHFSEIVPVTLSCVGNGVLTGNRLTRTADGPCSIIASTGMFLKSRQLTMQRYVPQVRNVWQSWVAGSLAAALESTTDVDLPFWRGSGFGFTAISPRHVIGCEHIYFMPPTLTLGGETRNLVSMEYIGPGNNTDLFASDLLVGLYDGDFPTFAKVFPSDLYDYLPNLRYDLTDYAGYDVPVFGCNQFGQKLRRTVGTVATNLSRIGLRKVDYYDPDFIGGDSGNPCFLVVDGEPVLLGIIIGGGAGGAVSINQHVAAINAAMNSLGGGYQLTQFDLSGFPSYA